ncbi:MAG: hypothetical protein MUO26_16040 [Methanotrichaceae archaeon]|nr:hypothetical protein [Methanotrichaceae archaeon]
MRSVKKLCLAVAFIILISTVSAIVEHSKAETVERMRMPPVLQSTGDEGMPISGIEGECVIGLGCYSAIPTVLQSPGNEGMPIAGMESGAEPEMTVGQQMPSMQETNIGYEGMPASGIESGYQPGMTIAQPLPIMQGVKPSLPYTIMAIGNREYIVAGWLDENTQIILLYHDMDEPTVRMRANQFFTSLGETAIRTIPSQ